MSISPALPAQDVEPATEATEDPDLYGVAELLKDSENLEDCWVWKIGLEYGFPLPGYWDIAIGGASDYKEVYDSFGVGISFGKRFGKPR